MTEAKKHGPWLSLAIGVAIVLAVVFALLAPRAATECEIGGTIFLNLLKMLVVPLVMCSVTCGILGLGDIRKLGRPAAATLGYYLATTLLAVVLGLVLVNLIQPGVATRGQEAAPAQAKDEVTTTKDKIHDHLAEQLGLPREDVAAAFGEAKEPDPTIGFIIKNLVLSLFTDNLFKSALEMSLLPLIIFSIIFAGVLTTLPNVEGLKSLIEQANTALMALVMLLMYVAPAGIFCLIAAQFGQAQAEGHFGAVLQQTGWYVVTVLVGLGVHAFVTLPAILFVLTRRNPYRFIVQMLQAILTAFSTASSTATLPVTMECAEKNAGVSRQSVEFVLPLGATINMDGTALYEAVAAIFIAQTIGMEMTFAHQVTIALTATLAAIGAAGIPQAGLVTMVIVLTAVGIPVEYLFLILSVDWFLDRFRTAVNCFGDACGAAVVERTMPQSDDTG
ncbi:MAG: dicarboxylate/amino acid:cation symporter [Pirellulales bacterium]|nr:dicarboxylate/amino acid:cation symporter [Pirellulales bacterium]